MRLSSKLNQLKKRLDKTTGSNDKKVYFAYEDKEKDNVVVNDLTIQEVIFEGNRKDFDAYSNQVQFKRSYFIVMDWRLRGSEL